MKKLILTITLLVLHSQIKAIPVANKGKSTLQLLQENKDVKSVWNTEDALTVIKTSGKVLFEVSDASALLVSQGLNFERVVSSLINKNYSEFQAAIKDFSNLNTALKQTVNSPVLKDYPGKNRQMLTSELTSSGSYPELTEMVKNRTKFEEMNNATANEIINAFKKQEVTFIADNIGVISQTPAGKAYIKTVVQSNLQSNNTELKNFTESLLGDRTVNIEANFRNLYESLKDPNANLTDSERIIMTEKAENYLKSFAETLDTLQGIDPKLDNQIGTKAQEIMADFPHLNYSGGIKGFFEKAYDWFSDTFGSGSTRSRFNDLTSGLENVDATNKGAGSEVINEPPADTGQRPGGGDLGVDVPGIDESEPGDQEYAPGATDVPAAPEVGL